ncbi:PqqD family protein [Verrucomicrobium sp. 3C]|uniref:PqqD family protein n=1 Tax=Verrucomicrobium sp. 3C TaxID=1134055 RepID=UPI0003652545|nr:PqqD family protein [Verrucomicrobium sp. 3C]
MNLSDPIAIATRYGVRESVLHTRLETESVLLDLDSGLYFSLNAVGSRIWDRLAEGPRTIDELLTEITNEYEVSREQAEPDLLVLLQELVRCKLLEPTDP